MWGHGSVEHRPAGHEYQFVKKNCSSMHLTSYVDLQRDIDCLSVVNFAVLFFCQKNVQNILLMMSQVYANLLNKTNKNRNHIAFV